MRTQTKAAECGDTQAAYENVRTGQRDCAKPVAGILQPLSKSMSNTPSVRIRTHGTFCKDGATKALIDWSRSLGLAA